MVLLDHKVKLEILVQLVIKEYKVKLVRLDQLETMALMEQKEYKVLLEIPVPQVIKGYKD